MRAVFYIDDYFLHDCYYFAKVHISAKYKQLRMRVCAKQQVLDVGKARQRWSGNVSNLWTHRSVSWTYVIALYHTIIHSTGDIGRRFPRVFNAASLQMLLMYDACVCDRSSSGARRR